MKDYLWEQFKIVWLRYFMWFNPRFWKDLRKSKHKLKTILVWPDEDYK